MGLPEVTGTVEYLNCRRPRMTAYNRVMQIHAHLLI